MKNIIITSVALASFAMSGSLYAGMNELLNQAMDTAETVQNTRTAVKNAKETAEAVADTDTSSFISNMVNELGVTETQARGGSGALFQMVKSRLPASDFSQVSAAIPGMDGLLGAASSTKPSLLSGVAALAGENSGIANAASLIDTFKQLDLSKGMVGQFSSYIVDYAKKSSGDLVGNLLKNALGGL